MDQPISVQLVEGEDIIRIDGVERKIQARESYFTGESGGKLHPPEPGIYLLWLDEDGQTNRRRFDFYDTVIKVV